MRSTNSRRNATNARGQGAALPAARATEQGTARRARRSQRGKTAPTAEAVNSGSKRRKQRVFAADIVKNENSGNRTATTLEGSKPAEHRRGLEARPSSRRNISASVAAANDNRYEQSAQSGRQRNTATHLYMRARSAASRSMDSMPAWRQRGQRNQGKTRSSNTEHQQKSNSVRQNAHNPHSTEPGLTETITGFPTLQSMLPVLGLSLIHI